MPRRAIDCHAHLLDTIRYPLSSGRGYVPLSHESGTLEEYCAICDHSKIAGSLLIQLSSYGYDNSALLAALESDPNRFKAIVVIPEETASTEILKLAKQGVVGVRFNLLSFDSDALRKSAIPDFLRRIRDANLFVEVVAHNEHWLEVAQILADAGVRILVDHFGMHSVPDDIHHTGFQAVLALGRETQAVVKLTTPYAVSLAPTEFDRLSPFVEQLMQCFGIERCVWGSDWPFLSLRNPPKYADTLNPLSVWMPDPDVRDRVLWANPIRLFGFDEKLIGNG